jgi:hypothetical protein
MIRESLNEHLRSSIINYCVTLETLSKKFDDLMNKHGFRRLIFDLYGSWQLNSDLRRFK